eukprot:TRINITY_DN411_c2_g1_i1.p1 TRINITY_DN411_c2_g1~~TRINITY_DN411_c2_g1_i1.p1  ORF type:complete len:269 (+),score=58.16 TRINITY_DN411_c2_g1_i1:966-1772(+)
MAAAADAVGGEAVPFPRPAKVAWTDHEVVLLVQEKGKDLEKYRKGGVPGGVVKSQVRWMAIAKELEAKNVHKGWWLCRTKWENALRDYRSIREHESKVGMLSYWDMDAIGRKTYGLPPRFARIVFDIMDQCLMEEAAANAVALAAGQNPTSEGNGEGTGGGGKERDAPAPKDYSEEDGMYSKRAKLGGQEPMVCALKEMGTTLSGAYALCQESMAQQQSLNWKIVLEGSEARAKELNETLLRAAQIQAEGLRQVAHAFRERRRLQGRQ